MQLTEVFRTELPVIGLVHLPPLPGAPAHCMSLGAIVSWALRDVDALIEGGVDGLIVENFGDAPYYPRRVPPETIAAMTVVATEVRAAVRLPIGINVLRNDGIAALAVAKATGAQFIRVNVYTGARLTDQGIVEGEAHELTRYRRVLDCPVAILADVAVKHSVPIARRSLRQAVEDAIARGRADAIIVSGEGTGKPTDPNVLAEAKGAAGPTPVLVGSGLDVRTLEAVVGVADGFIVGTAFKEGGAVNNPVSAQRVSAFVSELRQRHAIGRA